MAHAHNPNASEPLDDRCRRRGRTQKIVQAAASPNNLEGQRRRRHSQHRINKHGKRLAPAYARASRLRMARDQNSKAHALAFTRSEEATLPNGERRTNARLVSLHRPAPLIDQSQKMRRSDGGSRGPQICGEGLGPGAERGKNRPSHSRNQRRQALHTIRHSLQFAEGTPPSETTGLAMPNVQRGAHDDSGIGGRKNPHGLPTQRTSPAWGSVVVITARWFALRDSSVNQQPGSGHSAPRRPFTNTRPITARPAGIRRGERSAPRLAPQPPRPAIGLRRPPRALSAFAPPSLRARRSV